jgi:integrase
LFPGAVPREVSSMASLLKRGNKFYVRVYVKGKPKDIATKSSNIKIAEKLLQKVEYENATGQLATATKTPLGKLLEDFVAHLKASHRDKSVKNDTSRLRVLFGPLVPALELVAKRDNLTGEVQGKPTGREEAEVPRLVAEYAEQIPAPLINQYLDKRAARVSPKTLNEEREILYRLFRYAIEHHGLVYPDPRLKNPVDGVRPRKLLTHEIRFLNSEQITEQLQAIKEDKALHAAVAILIYAGVRREEALWLTREDVDRKTGLLRIRAKTIDGAFWQPKTGRNRTVPIGTALAAVLDKYKSRGPGPWLLPSPEGARWDPDNFSHKLADENAKAKLPWTCLDFRHTFGSMLAQRGVSLYKISAMMGNSPEICRKHYAALIPDQFVGDVNVAA